MVRFDIHRILLRQIRYSLDVPFRLHDLPDRGILI